MEAAGAMAAIMKDAVNPTVMQTTEGTLTFVHAGPFANIAYGNSSVIADQIALRLADFTVTESGFGADMGFEKLCNIKCRASGLIPDAAVLVVTIRALKAHCPRFSIKAGKPLDPRLLDKDLAAIADGLPNLKKHIENVAAHGVPVVVAINHFATDHFEEIEYVREKALEFGAVAAEISQVHAQGGAGGEALAAAVVQAADQGSDFHHAYDLEDSIANKIKALATQLYGAADIELAETAQESIARYESWGYGNLPICMAKTHLSLSHDPKLKGAPEGFLFPVRDVGLAAGAGFVYPLAGNMMMMPGLGSKPALRGIDIDAAGQIQGLF